MANSERTVGLVIRHVLPAGTLVFGRHQLSQKLSPHGRWRSPPDWPPDLFAVAGHLLRLSGAYSYLLPPNAVARLAEEKRAVTLTDGEVELWAAAGQQWQHGTSIPDIVRELWAELLADGDELLFQRPVGREGMAPAWWRKAYALFVIADEACDSMGYVGFASGDSARPFAGLSYMFFQRQIQKYAESSPAGHARVPDLSATVGINADPDIVCVQPKSRVASVGCALRTLSHNLALLPPRGVATVNWHRPLTDVPPEDDTAPLHVLTVPFPFSVKRDWFVSLATPRPPKPDEPGWLDLTQSWISDSDSVLEFLVSCVSEAKSMLGEGSKLHGVVLPEDAIDWKIHEAFADKLAQMNELGIEFLISGVSKNCGDDEGSHVVITRFDGSGEPKSMTSTSRSKHHRWQLDKPQAERYGLLQSTSHYHSGTPCGGGTLGDGTQRWWEAIGLPHRVIHSHVLRETTTMTALICEDLARSDPCHAIVRDIGPNIVIGILMDGPQIRGRWSERYALALADDPGSAVLTLTSRALVELSDPPAGTARSWSIGLWKDDRGSAQEILCPPGDHGVLLTLRSSKTSEQTFDGRMNTDARSWQMINQTPVRLRSGHGILGA